MTSKVLSVRIEAKDMLSPTVRAAAASFGVLAKGVNGVGAMAGDALSRVRAMVTSTRTLFAGLGAGFAGGLIARSIDQTARRMDDLLDRAKALRIDPQTLASWRYLAEVAGSTAEEVTTALSTGQKNIGQFLQTGGGRAAEVLRGLRVPLRDAQGNVRNIAELLPEIADEINRIPDAERRAFQASRLFGEAASTGTFVNVLSEGGERLRMLNDEARKLGIVFSPAQLQAANAYVDAMRRVSAAFEGLKARIVEALGPYVTEFADRLAGVVSKLPEIIERVRENFRKMVAPGEDGDEARRKWAEWAESLGTLLYTGIEGGVRLAVGFFRTAWSILLSDTGTEFERWLGGMALKVPMLLSKAVNEGKIAASAKLYGYEAEVSGVPVSQAIANVRAAATPYGRGYLGKQAMLSDLEIYGGRLDALQTELDQVDRRWREGIRSAAQLDKTLSQATNPTNGDRGAMSGMSPLFDEFTTRIRAQVTALLDATDALTGYRSAAKTFTTDRELQAGIRSVQTPAAPARDPSGLEEFGGGARDYLKGTRESLASLTEEGRKFGQTMYEAVGNQFASAIGRAMDNIKDFRTAFMEMGASVLRMARDMILQMITFRILAGIATSLTTAGVSAASSSIPSSSFNPSMGSFPQMPSGLPAGPNVPGLVSPFPAGRSGGYFTGSEFLPRFERGGFVRGSNVPVDGVIARLHAGESVLSAEGTARQDPRVLAMANRGVPMVPAGMGGGPSINVNVTVNTTGGVDQATIARLRSEVAAGVIDAIDRSPGYRAKFREAMGA